ncbi:MAG TPA: tetratricopeptide repeat protein, partial [Elusimicrobiales bacterium]|nr:tetratricopeptide repeat protein [Elusimicrobiales bacterium]
MSRSAALVFAVLAFMPSRAFTEVACVSLPNGEVMTCADTDKCVKNPSTGVWLTVGKDTYQCLKPSGKTDIPQYRVGSTAPVLKSKTVPGAKPFSFGAFPKLTRSVVPAVTAPVPAASRQRSATARATPPAAETSPAEAYRAAGYAHYAREDLPNAIANWEKARALDPGMRPELDPRLAEAYARRGALRLLNGDHARSIQDLDKAYELDPANRNIEKARERAYLVRSGRPGASGTAGPEAAASPAPGSRWTPRVAATISAAQPATHTAPVATMRSGNFCHTQKMQWWKRARSRMG